MKKTIRICCTFILLAGLLLGCGGPKADVSIFIMPSAGIDSSHVERLENALQQRMRDSLTVSVTGSPFFNEQKLLIEVAAGDNAIIIVPLEPFQRYAGQEGGVALEQWFDAADYPDGVTESYTFDWVNGEHQIIDSKLQLYGIPVHESPWFKDADITLSEPLYAMVLPREKTKDNGIAALQKIMAQ